MTREYDAIIIGTGQAGPPLAARFDREGRKVAVIERHKVGGSCVNVGCIPTKTGSELLDGGGASHHGEHSAERRVHNDASHPVEELRVIDLVRDFG